MDCLKIRAMTYDQVIEHFGSQADAARGLGLSQPSVWAWKTAGIPIERQIDIEVKTKGALRADLPAAVRRKTAA